MSEYTSLSKRAIGRKAAGQIAALGVLLPLSYVLLKPLLGDLDWPEISRSVAQIGAGSWMLALIATAASFAALGRYDVIVHRHLNTRQSEGAAQASGAAAVALGQVLGLGLVTGTIARWRALPSLSLVQAGSVTALVSLTFMVAWLGLLGLSGLVLPHSLPLPPYVFAACMISSGLLVLYTAVRRDFRWQGRRVRLPSLKAIGAMVGYAALDTSLAALAFWILIPAGADISLAALIPIYLAGLGCALLSNTPGGLGPFEVMLLWALQGTDLNAVIAGLIAFRLVYFAVPAVIGGLYLALPKRTAAASKAPAARIIRTPSASLHPEAHVARQGGALLTTAMGHPIAPVRRTTQATVALFDPPLGFSVLEPALSRAARLRMTWPIAYKISARNAVQARAAGWHVLATAADAIIPLGALSDAGKARATLRRKLRKSTAAGVQIRHIPLSVASDARIWQSLRQIEAAWSGAHGGARGFSMGQYSEPYLSAQQVFAASLDGRDIAFISFHHSPKTWVLDLMRHAHDVPDGCMHALVWHALKAAEARGVQTVSLASVPLALPGPLGRLSAKPVARAQGLAQFKRSFAPQWTPLFTCAPSRLALVLGLWDIWNEVRKPPATTTGPPARAQPAPP